MTPWLLAAAMVVVDLHEAGWAQFSRSSVLLPGETRISVGTLTYDARRRTLDYWLRRNDGSRTTWTDSRRCPQVRDILNAMRFIETEPQSGEIALFLDSARYTLDTPGSSGRGSTHIASGRRDSSLGRWVDTALASLEPCWSPTPPARPTGQ